MSFEDLLLGSDAISVHTPLTDLTRDLFNAEAFSKMKRGAIFVNAARGSIHNEEALADAIDAGHIAGAGLDVWDVEPPANTHRLLQMPNVIATPHIAGYTSDSLANMASYAATQLLEIFSGGRPPRAVNPEVLPQFRVRYAERFGEPVFPWYSRHPERSSIFDGAMTDLSRLDADALLASTDFSAIRHLVDVGGGRGELLQRVLHQHSHLQGTLFDQPAVVAAVEPPPELASRLQISGGDFFTGVPAGADAYLLKHILHDWDDADCQTILGQIRRSMASGGKVLILEQVIPSGNDPSPAKLLDLNMLVMTGGRERSRSEYSQLLEQSGLQLQAVHTTAAAIDMIEATAAE